MIKCVVLLVVFLFPSFFFFCRRGEGRKLKEEWVSFGRERLQKNGGKRERERERGKDCGIEG